MNNKRPKYLALNLTKLPLPGIVSILHRFSGLLLFFAVPWLLLMLQYSLRSIETYTQLLDVLASPLLKLLSIGILWAALHHFLAGLRYIAIDLHYVRNLAQARNSSKIVLALSLLLTVWMWAKLW